MTSYETKALDADARPDFSRLVEANRGAGAGGVMRRTEAEQETFAKRLHKMLSSMETTDWERRTPCRLCDDRVRSDCPIPANKPAET